MENPFLDCQSFERATLQYYHHHPSIEPPETLYDRVKAKQRLGIDSHQHTHRKKKMRGRYRRRAKNQQQVPTNGLLTVKGCDSTATSETYTDNKFTPQDDHTFALPLQETNRKENTSDDLNDCDDSQKTSLSLRIVALATKSNSPEIGRLGETNNHREYVCLRLNNGQTNDHDASLHANKTSISQVPSLTHVKNFSENGAVSSLLADQSKTKTKQRCLKTPFVKLRRLSQRTIKLHTDGVRKRSPDKPGELPHNISISTSTHSITNGHQNETKRDLTKCIFENTSMLNGQRGKGNLCGGHVIENADNDKYKTQGQLQAECSSTGIEYPKVSPMLIDSKVMALSSVLKCDKSTELLSNKINPDSKSYKTKEKRFKLLNQSIRKKLPKKSTLQTVRKAIKYSRRHVLLRNFNKYIPTYSQRAIRIAKARTQNSSKILDNADALKYAGVSTEDEIKPFENLTTESKDQSSANVLWNMDLVEMFQPLVDQLDDFIPGSNDVSNRNAVKNDDNQKKELAQNERIGVSQQDYKDICNTLSIGRQCTDNKEHKVEEYSECHNVETDILPSELEIGEAPNEKQTTDKLMIDFARKESDSKIDMSDLHHEAEDTNKQDLDKSNSTSVAVANDISLTDPSNMSSETELTDLSSSVPSDSVPPAMFDTFQETIRSHHHDTTNGIAVTSSAQSTMIMVQANADLKLSQKENTPFAQAELVTGTACDKSIISSNKIELPISSSNAVSICTSSLPTVMSINYDQPFTSSITTTEKADKPAVNTISGGFNFDVQNELKGESVTCLQFLDEKDSNCHSSATSLKSLPKAPMDICKSGVRPTIFELIEDTVREGIHRSSTPDVHTVLQKDGAGDVERNVNEKDMINPSKTDDQLLRNCVEDEDIGVALSLGNDICDSHTLFEASSSGFNIPTSPPINLGVSKFVENLNLYKLGLKSKQSNHRTNSQSVKAPEESTLNNLHDLKADGKDSISETKDNCTNNTIDENDANSVPCSDTTRSTEGPSSVKDTLNDLDTCSLAKEGCETVAMTQSNSSFLSQSEKQSDAHPNEGSQNQNLLSNSNNDHCILENLTQDIESVNEGKEVCLIKDKSQPISYTNHIHGNDNVSPTPNKSLVHHIIKVYDTKSLKQNEDSTISKQEIEVYTQEPIDEIPNLPDEHVEPKTSMCDLSGNPVTTKDTGFQEEFLRSLRLQQKKTNSTSRSPSHDSLVNSENELSIQPSHVLTQPGLNPLICNFMNQEGQGPKCYLKNAPAGAISKRGRGRPRGRPKGRGKRRGKNNNSEVPQNAVANSPHTTVPERQVAADGQRDDQLTTAYSLVGDSDEEQNTDQQNNTTDLDNGIQLHVNLDDDELPTILPPKRRRALHSKNPPPVAMVVTKGKLGEDDGSRRIAQEFPKHNWLENKINQLREKTAVATASSPPGNTAAEKSPPQKKKPQPDETREKSPVREVSYPTPPDKSPVAAVSAPAAEEAPQGSDDEAPQGSDDEGDLVIDLAPEKLQDNEFPNMPTPDTSDPQDTTIPVDQQLVISDVQSLHPQDQSAPSMPSLASMGFTTEGDESSMPSLVEFSATSSTATVTTAKSKSNPPVLRVHPVQQAIKNQQIPVITKNSAQQLNLLIADAQPNSGHSADNQPVPDGYNNTSTWASIELPETKDANDLSQKGTSGKCSSSVANQSSAGVNLIGKSSVPPSSTGDGCLYSGRHVPSEYPQTKTSSVDSTSSVQADIASRRPVTNDIIPARPAEQGSSHITNDVGLNLTASKRQVSEVHAPLKSSSPTPDESTPLSLVVPPSSQCTASAQNSQRNSASGLSPEWLNLDEQIEKHKRHFAALSEQAKAKEREREEILQQKEKMASLLKRLDSLKRKSRDEHGKRGVPQASQPHALNLASNSQSSVTVQLEHVTSRSHQTFSPTAQPSLPSASGNTQLGIEHPQPRNTLPATRPILEPIPLTNSESGKYEKGAKFHSGQSANNLAPPPAHIRPPKNVDTPLITPPQAHVKKLTMPEHLRTFGVSPPPAHGGVSRSSPMPSQNTIRTVRKSSTETSNHSDPLPPPAHSKSGFTAHAIREEVHKTKTVVPPSGRNGGSSALPSIGHPPPLRPVNAAANESAREQSHGPHSSQSSLEQQNTMRTHSSPAADVSKAVSSVAGSPVNLVATSASTNPRSRSNSFESSSRNVHKLSATSQIKTPEPVRSASVPNNHEQVSAGRKSQSIQTLQTHNVMDLTRAEPPQLLNSKPGAVTVDLTQSAGKQHAANSNKQQISPHPVQRQQEQQIHEKQKQIAKHRVQTHMMHIYHQQQKEKEEREKAHLNARMASQMVPQFGPFTTDRKRGPEMENIVQQELQAAVELTKRPRMDPNQQHKLPVQQPQSQQHLHTNDPRRMQMVQTSSAANPRPMPPPLVTASTGGPMNNEMFAQQRSATNSRQEVPFNPRAQAPASQHPGVQQQHMRFMMGHNQQGGMPPNPIDQFNIRPPFRPEMQARVQFAQAQNMGHRMKPPPPYPSGVQRQMLAQRPMMPQVQMQQQQHGQMAPATNHMSGSNQMHPTAANQVAHQGQMMHMHMNPQLHPRAHPHGPMPQPSQMYAHGQVQQPCVDRSGNMVPMVHGQMMAPYQQAGQTLAPSPHVQSQMSPQQQQQQQQQQHQHPMMFQHPQPQPLPVKGNGSMQTSHQGMAIPTQQNPVSVPSPHTPGQNAQTRDPVAQDKLQLCTVCKAEASFLCSGCKKIWYCSPACQTASWGKHYNECSAMATGNH